MTRGTREAARRRRVGQAGLPGRTGYFFVLRATGSTILLRLLLRKQNRPKQQSGNKLLYKRNRKKSKWLHLERNHKNPESKESREQAKKRGFVIQLDEIQIFSYEELREQRKTKRSKAANDSTLKRQREAPNTDSINAKRTRPTIEYNLRSRIQQSTDPPIFMAPNM
jgi:hypothetical protein